MNEIGDLQHLVLSNQQSIQNLTQNVERMHEEITSLKEIVLNNVGNGKTKQRDQNSSSLYFSYRDNLTTHGLSRVFNGKLWERIVWGVVLNDFEWRAVFLHPSTYCVVGCFM